MAKGYWIARIDVSDMEQYKKYIAANAAPLARHGGQFLVRAGTQRTREGDWFPRTVIIEFPSMEAAVACYEDPEYVEAIKIRQAVSEGRFLIVEGYDA